MSAVSVKSQKNNIKVLDLNSKMQILHILAVNNVKIDFSGGDPLYHPDDFFVVESATKIMSSEMIDVSMTGVDFNASKLALIKKVGKVEISVDNPPNMANKYRPRGFNSSVILILKQLVKEGVFCSGVTTLYPKTATKNNLRALYSLLCEMQVPKWNILRYYFAGQGALLGKELYMSDDELLAVMDFLDSLKGYTKIVFQHSLRILRDDYKCHAGNKAIGILPDGVVVACGWALDSNSRPLPGFELGKLPKDDFTAILKRAQNELGFNKRVSYCRALKRFGK
jgi:MoaA/NifB/PqqE/SkfB family radical SAM enzyme